MSKPLIVVVMLAAITFSVVGPYFIWRAMSRRVKEPQARGDGTWLFSGQLRFVDSPTRALRKPLRGTLLVDRNDLKWTPKRGTAVVMPYRDIAILRVVTMMNLAGSTGAKEAGVWLQSGEHGRVQFLMDAVERGARMELAWPAMRGERYSQWIARHLVQQGVQVQAAPNP